jgi:hypothetical protein
VAKKKFAKLYQYKALRTLRFYLAVLAVKKPSLKNLIDEIQKPPENNILKNLLFLF